MTRIHQNISLLWKAQRFNDWICGIFAEQVLNEGIWGEFWKLIWDSPPSSLAKLHLELIWLRQNFSQTADHLIHPTSNVRGDCCSSMPWWMRWSCGMCRMYCKKSPRNGMVSWNDFPTWIKKKGWSSSAHWGRQQNQFPHFFGWFYPSQQKSVKQWFSKSLMAGSMLISCNDWLVGLGLGWMGLAAASKMAPAASASLTPDLCCSGRRPDDMPWNAMECHGMPWNAHQ